MKKLRRKIFLGAAIFFVLMVLFLVIEHFRGKVSLAKYKKALNAKGEKLSVHELTPQIPEGANGAPVFLRAAGQLRDGNAIRYFLPPAMRVVAPGHAIVGHRQAEWVDEDYRTSRTSKIVTNNWAGLAQDLEKNQETLDAIRAALQQPILDARLDYSRGFEFDVGYWMQTKSTAQWLSAATLNDLHNGDTQKALENLQALSGLVRLHHNDPILIGQLVRIAIASIEMSAAWEALQADGWTDSQWARLQHILQTGDFIGDTARALEMERAIGQTYYDRFRRSNHEAAEIARIQRTTFFPDEDDEGKGLAAVASKLPYGEEIFDFFSSNIGEPFVEFVYVPFWQFSWSYQDQRRHLENCQLLIENARLGATTKSAAVMRTHENAFKSLLTPAGPYDRCRFLFSPTSSSLSRAASKAMRCETHRSLTMAAVALKRYRLRHGKAASDLASLVPEFLPQVPIDLMDGQPLRYRLNADGSFLLYSIGEDGKDDGGDPVRLSKGSKPSFWYGRDLVWPTPASPEEIAAFETEESKQANVSSTNAMKFLEKMTGFKIATNQPNPKSVK